MANIGEDPVNRLSQARQTQCAGGGRSKQQSEEREIGKQQHQNEHRTAFRIRGGRK